MLRTRDFVAIVLAVILTRMAWKDTSQDASLAATVHLSFYVPTRDDQDNHMARAIKPAIFDVDGDGTAEALVVLMGGGNGGAWKVQILDLKPAMTKTVHLAPFRPRVLLESAPIHLKDNNNKKKKKGVVEPKYVTTGHVLMTESSSKSKPDEKKPNEAAKPEDRSRHFFCGTDWHDAASKCGTPCPGGTSDACPEGERCFADTPCDSLKQEEEKPQKMDTASLRYTPAGTLPSIVTLWSNGAVTLHSLTGDNSTQNANLEVRLLWQVNPLSNYTVDEWENHHVAFVDAVSAGNGHGMLLITGGADFVVDEEDEDGTEEVHFVIVLDAKTGETLWESLSDEEELQAEKPKLVLPAHRGTTSYARRRSLNPNLQRSSRDSLLHPGTSVANCMHAYRRSLLTSDALPFLQWTPDDAQSKALHFEHQHGHSQIHHYHHKSSHHHSKHKMKSSAGGNKASSWSSWLPGSKKKSRKHASQPRYGRPNVVVTYNYDGMEVRSLKNGRPLCHLSLWEETLYADLNHDGILDSVNIITGKHAIQDDDDPLGNGRWIGQLARRINALDNNNSSPDDAAKHGKDFYSQNVQDATLCHAQALSGLPSKEEIFSVNICGSKRDQEMMMSAGGASAGPPLVVEAWRGKGQDVVAAVSSGFVTRIQGPTGRRQWQLVGKHHQDFPTWEGDSNVVLGRIESKKVIPATRPIVLVGENSLAIVSARRGAFLASSTFPQPSIERPLVADLNGDGTTDILVHTADALWGYQVHVQTGAFAFFRIAVGLLLMAMMLAVVRNRFGPQPGKRSTDA